MTDESEKIDDARTINVEEFTRFVAEFRGESDRAAVILGAAKLDLVMYQILQQYLVPITGSKDELLDGDSALGTFSSKINLIHRLGLISGEFTRALHIIRRIRNSFAHEVSGCTLDSGAHSDRVKELITPIKHYNWYDGVKNHFFAGEQGASVDFRVALAILVGRLEVLLANIETVDQSEALNILSSSSINMGEKPKKLRINKLAAKEIQD